MAQGVYRLQIYVLYWLQQWVLQQCLMLQINIDNSSINAFASSYHKLSKINKITISDSINLPPLHHYLAINAKLNVKPLLQHIKLIDHQLTAPLFTLSPYNKLKSELKSAFKKYFHQKLKEVNQGNLLVLRPGEAIHVRSDFFCLTPHSIYTILIPLQKCQLNSGGIAISSGELVWQGESEQQLFVWVQERQVTWQYGLLQEGDVIMIGRDCVYGSFRNDSSETKHYVEMRWILNQYSSSSSNSSS